MKKIVMPEKRSWYSDDNFYNKTLSNGQKELYNKDYFNSDFTRKHDDNEIENIKKLSLLREIEEELKKTTVF